ncbi:tetratricopeptide repeat protein [Mucilaginibacter sp. AK015]|uniref:tetratricopeptide repeat-containing sensor histidine kinase n=1 Tax=Mucilaginibacter sp. AK015 TaxID=2723072 RepID=UPI00160F083B|nr:signal transduction histidine kinase [Mucilaginibacter sp. AK015]
MSCISRSQPVPAKPDDTIDYYNKLVLRYRYDKPDSATYFANLGLEVAKRLKNLRGQALMLNQLGMIADNVGQFDSSRTKYLDALKLYKQIGHTTGMATENIRLGVVEIRNGQYDKAIGYFLQALDLSQHNGNLAGQMESYITLGEAFAAQKKYTEAIRYYKVAEGLNNKLPFSNLSLNLFNDIASAFRETGRLDEAKAYLLKGIKQSNVPQYQGLNITLTNTLASVYAKAGDRQTSIKLQKSALEKARKINNYIRQIQTLTGLATTYGKADPKNALYYWQQAYKLSKSKGTYNEQIADLNAIADIYKSQQNYKQAYEARTKQLQLADTFFYKKMSKQIVSLQNAYELNQSKARVQELRFANNKNKLEQNIAYAVIAGVLVILLVVIFYYFKTRRLNLLLNKTNAELQESNTVKDKLFSVLGHDLRSPFISVINLLEIIDDDLEPEQRRAMLHRLEINTRASLDTLDSLLRWGQMQIKGIQLNQTHFFIAPLIKRSVLFLSGVAAGKGIHIQSDVADDVKVLADADHLEFIIRNLLSNAIKFSEVGSDVTITAASENGLTAITVTDKGIGIPADKIKGIFNLNNVSTRGTGNESGTGLGLLLCKEFAEVNHGSIQVTSKQGEGSAFTVTLKTA